jgi:uncharacterized protein (DUF885 family)
MKTNFRSAVSLAAILLLTPVLALANNSAKTPAKTPATPEKLNQLYADYWEENLQANPMVATRIGDNRFNDRYGAVTSAERRAISKRMAEKYLARSAEFDPAGLSADDRISYDLLRYNLQQSLDAQKHPSHLIPINQIFGQHLGFAQLGSGRSAQPFRTEKDYDNWLARAAVFPAVIDDWIKDMREGIKIGVVLPKALVLPILPQLESLSNDDLDKNVYFSPAKKFPAGVSEEEQKRLTAAYTKLVRETMAPAHRKLLAFVRDTYLPASRKSVGLSAIPGGKAWYAFQAKSSTNTDLTPEAIHTIGLNEVARIRALFETAKTRTGFKGTLKEFIAHLNTAPELRFKTREEIQAAYESLRPRVDAKVPAYFGRLPKMPFEIRPVEAFREVAAAPAQYSSGLADGSRPGIFYYNAYQPETRTRFTTTAFFVHEAIPGHHFETSLKIEHPSLPAFRRFGGSGAYSEGWGLYCEMLGEEMGLYDDPWQYVGRLSAEIWRAVRLVVDTGVHAKGWTREQAIAYFLENVPQGEIVATQEVERYIGVPGQALSYKIGEIKIRELRTRAEESLGKKFDIREFHDEILTHGSVPLAVLEAAVDRWIAAKRKS